MLIPPIKCQGIKTKLVKQLLQHFPEKCSNYIEPFMGSGIVGFNANYRNAIFGDINKHIIAFYNTLKYANINDIRQFLECEGEKLRIIENYYYIVRNRFNNKHDPLDFLFLTRSCFNGLMRFNKMGHFNTPFCKNNNRFSKAYITKIINQISKVQELIQVNNWIFQHIGFDKLIKQATSKDFIYCDPPYHRRTNTYYTAWSEDDEKMLANLLQSTKAKFMLSTWYGNEYRYNDLKYWHDYRIIKYTHFYHVGGYENNRHKMIEAIICNY